MGSQWPTVDVWLDKIGPLFLICETLDDVFQKLELTATNALIRFNFILFLPVMNLRLALHYLNEDLSIVIKQMKEYKLRDIPDEVDKIIG